MAMNIINVKWTRRSAIGAPLRSMEREFASAKKAAEFACDILYMLYGPDVSNAHTDKHYTVSRDRPRIEHQNSAQDEWVTVQYVVATGGGEGGEGRKNSAT
jgi:hypothetical protein